MTIDCDSSYLLHCSGRMCWNINRHLEKLIMEVAILQARGVLQALSIHKKWKAYASDYEGSQKLVFSLREPAGNDSICFGRNSNRIRISLEPKKSSRDWNFQVDGYFPDRHCSIIDSNGHVIAKVNELPRWSNFESLLRESPEMTTRLAIMQVGVKKEVKEMMESKDIYHVTIGAGIDQAFVFGVIVVLDHIYGESTTC